MLNGRLRMDKHFRNNVKIDEIKNILRLNIESTVILI